MAEKPKVRVFTTTPGDVRRIGNHGVATNDVAAEVPHEVAKELESSSLFRVERASPAPKAEEAPKRAAPKAKE